MTIEMERKVNQKTIAEHLHVSVATVSKALRGRPDVSLATRRQIEQAAEELGYRRQRGRRQPRSRSIKCRLVGVFVRRPIDGGAKNVPTYLDGMSRLSVQQNVSLVVQE